MDPELQALGARLAESVVRNTAAAIADRINTLRAKRRDADTIAELEQIVNDLIADKSELVRIAQAYQEELVAQQISKSDVEYITTNIVPVFEKLIESSAPQGGGTAGVPQQFMDLIRPILSVETVTVLQLLGFNFRKAVGQPLTELVSHAILAKMSPNSDSTGELQRLTLQREVAFYEIAKDPDAHARLAAMLGPK
jgi:hypothetical protein